MRRLSGTALNPVLGQTALTQLVFGAAPDPGVTALMPDIIGTLLPLALAFIMFAVGVTLVPADFTRLFEQPRAVIAGLIGQLVLLPLLAWALAVGLATVARDGRRPRDPGGLSGRREFGADHPSRARLGGPVGDA